MSPQVRIDLIRSKGDFHGFLWNWIYVDNPL